MFFRRSKPDQKGFNLLEVMVASFIFSTVAVAFLGVWGLQVRGSEKARHKLVATMLAEELIEKSMDDGYERTPVTREQGEPIESDTPVEETIEMKIEKRGAAGNWETIDVDYETKKSVVEIGSDGDKLKKVTVVVNWTDSTKRGEVSLVTYLAGVN